MWFLNCVYFIHLFEIGLWGFKSVCAIEFPGINTCPEAYVAVSEILGNSYIFI